MERKELYLHIVFVVFFFLTIAETITITDSIHRDRSSIDTSNEEKNDKSDIKILITGGKNFQGYLSDVEILQPWTDTNDCNKPADYPLKVDSPNGVNDIVCGGFVDGRTASNKCYQLYENEWKEMHNLVLPRWGASSTMLPNGSMWITGGSDGGDAPADTSEILNSSEMSSNIPGPMFLHCSAKVNDTHIFLAAGYNVYSAYLVDVASDEFIWTHLPQMKNDRWGSACGTIINKEATDGSTPETLLIVAGGNFGFYNREPRDFWTEVYSMTTEKWEYGPELPRPFRFGGYISNEKHNLIMIGGQGEHYTDQSDAIEYQPDTNTFEILPGKLITPRNGFVATELNNFDC